MSAKRSVAIVPYTALKRDYVDVCSHWTSSYSLHFRLAPKSELLRLSYGL